MAHEHMEFAQAKIPESLFTTEHFALIADFLLNSVVPTYCANGIDDGNWMEDTIAIIYASSMGDESANLDYISKWRWALAQMAQYCVDNRLRTPLGKPADTFLKLENEIRRLALNSLTRKSSTSSSNPPANIKVESASEKDEPTSKTLTVTRSRRGQREDDEEFEETNREPRQLSSAEQWWRVRALLETVELLDKLMSFACDGALFQLCVVSQTSQQFFVTNEATCSGWMSRMYLMTMAVAYGNGHYEHVLRLGAEARPEAMDAAAHTCISWMVRSLVDMGRAQPIMGIYAWVKKVYRLRFAWIKYAADMAAGRIEAALDGLVSCVNDAKQPDNVRKTVRQLIIVGLSRLRNPEEMIRVWRALDGSQGSDEKLCAVPDGFEEFAWSKLKGLVNFDPPAEMEKCEAVAWDVERRLEASELRLMQIARAFKKDCRNDIAELTKQLGDDARLIMMADTSVRTHTRASTLHLLATAVKDSLKPTHKQMLSANMIDPSFLFELDSGPCIERLTLGQQLSCWLENYSHTNGAPLLGLLADERTFHLKMCTLARKMGNLRLADRQLRFHASQQRQQPQIANEVNSWHMLNSQEMLHADSALSSAIETAKLLWAQCGSNRNGTLSHAEPFALLCDAVADEVERVFYKRNVMFNGAPSVPPNALLPLLAHHFTQTSVNDSAVLAVGMSSKPQSAKQLREEGEVLANATLRMAAWLSRDSSLMNVAAVRCQRIAWHMFAAEQSILPAISGSGATGGLIGALLSVACKLAPHLSKSHERLAEWAYKSARASSEDASGGMLLTSEEKDAIKWQLKSACAGLNEMTVEAVLSAVANAHHINSLRDDVRAAVADECPPGLCDQLLGTGSAIVQVWTTARGRMMAYYACAVRSYFTYIAECGNTPKEEHKGTIGTVVATLRIVRLLVRHSDSLHALVDAEMRRTNEFLWKDILPQLFARLNHPVAAVRDTLCALLERVAALAPHAVCFPAIVGATQPIVMHSAEPDDEDSEDERKSDEIEEDLLEDVKKRQVEQDRSLMYECCQRVVARLENLYPELVKDVSDFVKELQRINMLNEERWTFVLSNLDHEMSKRIAQIEAEKMKTQANDYLTDEEKNEIINEKTKILSAMVFRILEDLYDRTCVRDVHTVNERQFRDTYKSQIAAAFDVYRGNKLDPRKAWHPFKQLLIHLTQRCNKRSLQTLQTAEVTPRLLAFSHSHIPVPGQESKDFSDVVMIERVSKQSIVLPTKTRPKKIVFIGSDGVDYPFLFKGQEDLHLDERIMQLLHICNLMLAQKRSDWPPYSARNYSVTPLGSRSGLIQWVEGATPMFHVYRKWQIRQAARKAASPKGATEVERPSELFFKKLKTAFDANSISPDALTDRQKWPLPILKSVLEELIKETPRDLLSRELWLRAGSAYTWYRTTERFARSTAVMSMLGSVLGLGDRHLDNVLVNLESGHIVHIDYNICFDKAETVPFRLTGNMVNALGPTQIEGTFRLSCEHVLTKLRAGKEVLLTILDAFVYDPLVDWAGAHDHLVSSATVGVATTLAVYGTDARAEAARPLARALFAVRIKEMHMAWLENRERLYNTLTRVTDVLEKTHKYREGHHEYGAPLKGRIGDESAFETERVEAGRDLKQAITAHHDMMHDIRPLIRSLAHIDDRFRTYVRFYKESFSEPLVKGHKLLDEAGVDFPMCIRLFRSVLERIHQVYDELLLLDKGDGTLLSPCAESLPVPPPGFEEATPHFKQQQEQNVHAKNVSRKVRQKLEGRDFTATTSDEDNAIPVEASAVKKPMTPAEQADALIREATSLSNLALMYEGWTAWV
ncbi:unnamed protein product [Toxocara canis]|uniref:non-specific serine/threonine protein kinase n=1 Tax=Toxocara canis TaxID=6265 RepID=A0A183UR61_TOXCA|nr:unnamed protein product [Toxocara canis]